MGFVDQADQHILTSLSPHHKLHWSAAEKMWEITMLLVVNARKVYMSAMGSYPLHLPEWQKIVWNFLLKNGEPDAVKKEHPPSVHQKNQNSLSHCKSCAWRKEETHTTWRCPECGPICKHCQRKVGKRGKIRHEKFYLSPTSSHALQRTYKLPTPEKTEVAAEQ